jgi:dTDP-4-dehydrorhamnose reductase
VRTGHHERLEDIDRVASLGITKLRYPVLWERIAPQGLKRANWSWTDERLHRLKDCGIEPIATLLHHGSGPWYTNLLDEEFPEKLAEFAGAVARRYPWLRRFTPVNEPLTTARFSALYGLWYPHCRSDRDFVRALFNQIRGIAAAMRAIREVIPDAQLVQTEDLGKTYGTPMLEQQVRFDNDRRWATYDILYGQVRLDAPFMQFVQNLGFSLDAPTLAAMQCEPEIAGVNYYVTGERFLDDRLHLYPRACAGGNERQAYVDVEAVRVPEGTAGLMPLALECWERYRRPLAVTEAHIACTQEEQVRWLDELHTDCIRLRAAGAHVRAFTVWALFGAYDWNSCLTNRTEYYENGVFDVRTNPPSETALAEWTRAAARGERLFHRSLRTAGWWRRPERVLYSDEPATGLTA